MAKSKNSFSALMHLWEEKNRWYHLRYDHQNGVHAMNCPECNHANILKGIFALEER